MRPNPRAVHVKSDKDRWNNRYHFKEPSDFEPNPFLIEHRKFLTSGLALDVACGYGGNALFAASRGYDVHAVDISFNALDALNKKASQNGLHIQCIVADLDTYPLPECTYDLVMVFRFYSEPLMTALASSLKPAGMLFYATYNFRHTSTKPDFNAAYLVPPGGLAQFFPDLQIIVNEPIAGLNGEMAHLLACKKSEWISEDVLK